MPSAVDNKWVLGRGITKLIVYMRFEFKECPSQTGKPPVREILAASKSGCSGLWWQTVVTPHRRLRIAPRQAERPSGYAGVVQ